LLGDAATSPTPMAPQWVTLLHKSYKKVAEAKKQLAIDSIESS